jgi:hypothetical protein
MFMINLSSWNRNLLYVVKRFLNFNKTYMSTPQVSQNHLHSAIYGFGVIGALIYFIQKAATIWEGLIGIGEAIFWPAVVVYHLFEYFKV